MSIAKRTRSSFLKDPRLVFMPRLSSSPNTIIPEPRTNCTYPRSKDHLPCLPEASRFVGLLYWTMQFDSRDELAYPAFSLYGAESANGSGCGEHVVIISSALQVLSLDIQTSTF